MTLKGPHLVLSPDWLRLSLYFSPQDINTGPLVLVDPLRVWVLWPHEKGANTSIHSFTQFLTKPQASNSANQKIPTVLVLWEKKSA